MKKKVLKIIYSKLAEVAKEMLTMHKPEIIAITGSVGKTSTKEAIAHLLRTVHGEEVRATSGNLNAEIGVPLSIMGYSKQPSKTQWPLFLIKIKKHLKDKKYPRYLVLEMGVENPGDIDYFCNIAKPSIAVITAATPAHVANFSDLSDMQNEKLKLSKYVKPDNLFYNADDEYLFMNIKNGISYSANKSEAEIYAECLETTINGNKYDLIIGEDRLQISNKLIGKQMVYSDLVAAGVARKLGMKLAEIRNGLNSRKPYIGRMNLLKGSSNINIIDDTYNANPASVKAAIDTLSDMKYPGRKVLILGNMNELGNSELEEHLKISRYIPENIDVVIFSGPHSIEMKKECHASQVFCYKNRLEVQKKLKNIIRDNDLVLVKASQNKNYFEEIVKCLLNDNIKSEEVLVRQGREWKRKKGLVY